MKDKKMIEKINGLSFPGECLGPNGEPRRCEYSVSAVASAEGVLVTVDCDSWLGANCVFNETYEEFSVEQLLEDLHAQHLEQVEEKIADVVKEMEDKQAAERAADWYIDYALETRGNADVIVCDYDGDLGLLGVAFEKRGYDVYRKFFPSPKTKQFQSLSSDEIAAVKKDL